MVFFKFYIMIYSLLYIASSTFEFLEECQAMGGGRVGKAGRDGVQATRGWNIGGVTEGGD